VRIRHVPLPSARQLHHSLLRVHHAFAASAAATHSTGSSGCTLQHDVSAGAIATSCKQEGQYWQRRHRQRKLRKGEARAHRKHSRQRRSAPAWASPTPSRLQQQAGGLALRAESPAPKVSVRRTPRSPGAPAKTEACARQDKTRQAKARQDKARKRHLPGLVFQLRVSYVMPCPEPVLASENSSEETALSCQKGVLSRTDTPR
jgi:hypothetical protein